MSKSREIVDPRVDREQRWALEAFHARLTFPQMRALALEPPERGGLGYPVSLSGVKALVVAARAANGDLSMGREERVERQSDEIDGRARAARYDLERAHVTLQTPPPDRGEFFDSVEYRDALDVWRRQIEAATKLVESADRRLAAAMKDERDLHGLNAPTRIEADVTTRDGMMSDLEAALAALDAEEVSR